MPPPHPFSQGSGPLGPRRGGGPSVGAHGLMPGCWVYGQDPVTHQGRCPAIGSRGESQGQLSCSGVLLGCLRAVRRPSRPWPRGRKHSGRAHGCSGKTPSWSSRKLRKPLQVPPGSPSETCPSSLKECCPPSGGLSHGEQSRADHH